MEYKMNKIVTDSFVMSYLRFGNGKKPLVILPGLSVQSVITSAPSIVNQYTHFTDDFTVYVFDRRSDPPTSYDIFQMADDTAQAFKELELSGIYLFGVSQGGMIGLTIAALYPDLISRLSVCSTAMRIDDNRLGVIREWIRLAEEHDRERLYLSMGKSIFSESFFEKIKETFIQMSKTVTDEELTHFIILANGISGFDLTERIGQIRCPVQLSYDEEDTVLGENPAAELKEHLRTLDVFEEKSFNGFGHALYDTAPSFGEWLYNFFR